VNGASVGVGAAPSTSAAPVGTRISLGSVRGESDDWVTLVANGILAAVVEEAAFHEMSGPFTLDDFQRAWLERETDTVSLLPAPPGSHDASLSQRRTYWFYEGCRALEEGAWIAEVGEGKFAVASLAMLVAQRREESRQN
jgi:hypothetical protein